MLGKGLAETAEATTPAPKKMYRELEQGENVARGCVEVKELIAYEATSEPRRCAPEKPGIKGEIKTDRDGKILYVEISRKPCFCQTPEQERIFRENNSDSRIETFTIQLLKSTAIEAIDNPENMKQFEGRNKND